jgi:hypothetical protein
MRSDFQTKLTTIAAAMLFCLLMACATPFTKPAHAAEPAAKRLATAARESVGKELWKPGYGLSVGTYGCSAAICNILKKIGIKNVSSALVTVMRRQLLNNAHCSELTVRDGKGTQIDDAVLLKLGRPGDILVATMEPPGRLNGGGNAHCGIMGNGTQIYTNDWNNGIWSSVNVHQMFDAYPYVKLLRLP